MKNPLTYFKHIVKDPITTVAEADARKKEIMPLFYGSLGVMALGVILQTVAKLDFMVAFSFLGLVGAGFCGFLFAVISTAKKRFECLTCDHCHTLAEVKTMEDFAKYISFTVVKDEATFQGYTGNKEPTNGVYTMVKYSGSSSGMVEVFLTCPNCGQVKQLTYCCTPFRCHAEAKNVHILDYQTVCSNLESAVRTTVNDYNDLSKKDTIPYTFHSSKNPNFEKRYEFKGANGVDAHPDYMGVRIDYHKDVEELLLHYFILNELTGTLSDPNAASKKKEANSRNESPASPAPLKNESLGENAGASSPTEPSPQPTQEAPTPSENSATVSCSVTAPVITQSVESPMEEPMESPMEEPVITQRESTPAPQSHPREEEVPFVPAGQAFSSAYVPREPEEISGKTPGNKNRKITLMIVILAVCVALLAGGIVAILVGIKSNPGEGESGVFSSQEEPSVPSSSAESLPESASPSVATFNVNDYIGYWHKPGSDKELAIHSGSGDSVNFSLWYDNRTQLTNVTAQLKEGTFEFTLAANGGVVKGRLTFQPHTVMLHIIQSTSSQMPAEIMTFTQQDFNSQIPEEEESPNNQNYENNWGEDHGEPQLTYHEVPYLLSVTDDSYGIFSGPDYHSEYTRDLPKGTYTIVEEQYDEYDNLWGKLKSGVGWVCVERSEY